MDTNERIRQLMKERGWTEYRLAKKACLSQSTIVNLFHRNTVPSIATLSSICSAFGITLSDFFREDTDRESNCELLSLWASLTDAQREALLRLMQSMNGSLP